MYVEPENCSTYETYAIAYNIVNYKKLRKEAIRIREENKEEVKLYSKLIKKLKEEDIEYINKYEEKDICDSELDNLIKYLRDF